MGKSLVSCNFPLNQPSENNLYCPKDMSQKTDKVQPVFVGSVMNVLRHQGFSVISLHYKIPPKTNPGKIWGPLVTNWSINLISFTYKDHKTQLLELKTPTQLSKGPTLQQLQLSRKSSIVRHIDRDMRHIDRNCPSIVMTMYLKTTQIKHYNLWKNQDCLQLTMFAFHG